MPSNHLILCRPLFLLPSVFLSIRVFSKELALHIRWPVYWRFSFSPCSNTPSSRLLSAYLDFRTLHVLPLWQEQCSPETWLAGFLTFCRYSKSPTREPSSFQCSKVRRCSLFQQGTRGCAISFRCEWNCHLPSVSYSWWSLRSVISHLLQPVTLLACSLHPPAVGPAVILHFSAFQGSAL